MSQATRLLLALLLLSGTVAAAKVDLFLLKTYDPNKSQAVVGWVMSEKLDGVRGFWDGKQLLSRSGKKFNPPAWFVANYPPFAIDGELWTRRRDFATTVSIVRSKNAAARWRRISHQIFEVPQQAGGLLERLSVLQRYLLAHPNPAINIIEQIPITRAQQVADYLAEVVDKGGEGVVVRDPKVAYKTGRLASALKLKRYMDAECQVREIIPGKGKYTNKMGSLLCATSSGKMLKIGSGFSDKQRENPPAIGSEISFKHYGFNHNGKFKYPVFLRIRQR